MSAKLKLAPGIKPIRIKKKDKEGGKSERRRDEKVQSSDGEKTSCSGGRSGK